MKPYSLFIDYRDGTGSGEDFDTRAGVMAAAHRVIRVDLNPGERQFRRVWAKDYSPENGVDGAIIFDTYNAA